MPKKNGVVSKEKAKKTAVEAKQAEPKVKKTAVEAKQAEPKVKKTAVEAKQAEPKEKKAAEAKPGDVKVKKASIDIRQMEIDDIPGVFHLGEKLFTARRFPTLYRTWDEFEVVNRYQTDTEYCLVAYAEVGDEEKLVGFALGTIIEKNKSSWTYGWLLWLGTDPDFQGGGVATKLFKAFHHLMLEEGCRILIVDTEADNKPAIHFFEKMGFDDQEEHIYLSMNIDEERRKYEEKHRDHEEDKA